MWPRVLEEQKGPLGEQVEEEGEEGVLHQQKERERRRRRTRQGHPESEGRLTRKLRRGEMCLRSGSRSSWWCGTA